MPPPETSLKSFWNMGNRFYPLTLSGHMFPLGPSCEHAAVNWHLHLSFNGLVALLQGGIKASLPPSTLLTYTCICPKLSTHNMVHLSYRSNVLAESTDPSPGVVAHTLFWWWKTRVQFQCLEQISSAVSSRIDNGGLCCFQSTILTFHGEMWSAVKVR